MFGKDKEMKIMARESLYGRIIIHTYKSRNKKEITEII